MLFSRIDLESTSAEFEFFKSILKILLCQKRSIKYILFSEINLKVKEFFFSKKYF